VVEASVVENLVPVALVKLNSGIVTYEGNDKVTAPVGVFAVI
jgi:hypothetical protein